MWTVGWPCGTNDGHEHGISTSGNRWWAVVQGEVVDTSNERWTSWVMRGGRGGEAEDYGRRLKERKRFWLGGL